MKIKIILPVLFITILTSSFIVISSISKNRNERRLQKAMQDSSFFAWNDRFYNWMAREDSALRAVNERMRDELFSAMYKADSLRAEKALKRKNRLFFRLVERIKLLRNAGSQQNGNVILGSKIKISTDDYLLMGSDNSCARRNFPNISRDELYEFFEFAGDSDLTEESAGYNATFTQGKDGKWLVDSFRTNLPKQQYQSSPEEVVWHYMRLKELRQKNIPQEQRIKIMQTESLNKPWLKNQ